MKKENYTILDNSIWDDENLTHSEFRVLSYLIRLYNSDYGYSFPTRETLVKKCKMNKDTLGKVLNSLEDKGYITRTINKMKGGRNNIYYIHKYLVVRNNNESLQDPPQDDIDNNSNDKSENLTEPSTNELFLSKSDKFDGKLTEEQRTQLNRLDTDRLMKAIEKAEQNGKYETYTFNYLIAIYNKPIEIKSEVPKDKSKVVTRYHGACEQHFERYTEEQLEDNLCGNNGRINILENFDTTKSELPPHLLKAMEQIKEVAK